MISKEQHNAVETRTAPIREVRVSKNADGSNTVEGYAIRFNSESVDLGGFTEIVSPGALARTLAGTPDILCLRDHKQELLLGRTTSGTLQLRTDDKGLSFICSLPATTTGTDLAESLRRGDIDSCSFGFTVASDTWTTDGKGNDKRTLLDLDLFEISIVSFPAYESTTASIRSAPLEVRSRIEAKRSVSADADDPTTVDTGCVCACPECIGGDCSKCSDPDCDCEGCDCDGQSERSRISYLVRSEALLRLAEMTSTTL